MQAMSARSFLNMKAILEFPTVLINYLPRATFRATPEEAPHDIDLFALERGHAREEPAPALAQLDPLAMKFVSGQASSRCA
jgi:hypothetical protein